MKEPQNANNELFEKIVVPRLDWIKNLVVCFSYYPNEIDDNYNIVLIAIWRYIDSYDPNIDFKKWGYVVIRNCVLRLNKLHYRYHNHFSDMDYNQDKPYNEYNPNLFFSVDDKIYNALRTITDKQLRLLKMRINGYKFSEMADIYNVCENTIKSRYFATRIAIKALL